MRIHAHTLTLEDIRYAASQIPSIYIVRFSEHKSRSKNPVFDIRYTKSFDIIISGSSSHGINSSYHHDNAATYDEWGAFLNVLYGQDRYLCISHVYYDRDSFHQVTGNRFEFGMPKDTHSQHKWQHDWNAGINYCTKCSASMQPLDWKLLKERV